MSAHASLIKAPGILSDVRELLASSIQERAASISAIKESVSAVEAFMNELCELAYGYENVGHKSEGNKPENRIVLLGQSLRKAEAERKSIKAKVEISYESLTSKNMAKGNTQAYQRFSLVVDVRNELAHPKASVMKFENQSMVPPKKEQQLIKKLRSYGFSSSKMQYDWTQIVSNRAFALWSYQASIDIMSYILQFWPFAEAIESFHEMYGLKLREIES